MSPSAWDSIYDVMVRVALYVDRLKWVMFWLVLVVVFIWLCAALLKAFNYFNGYGSGLGAGDSDPTSDVVNRLDELACIAISRRPRTRKHRHRHHSARTDLSKT